VNREDALDRLELDDQSLLDEEIDDISTLQRDSLVLEWNRDLTPESDACRRKLVSETFLVGRFEKARTHLPMDLDARTEDDA
jgi:hypothetical protein